MNLTQQVTWVPVSERLPEFTGVYQAASKTGAVHSACVFLWIGDTKQWVVQSGHFKTNVTSAVTHWAEPLKHPTDL